MQLRIYNRDMELLGIIENAYSIQWTRKYTSCGSFEVHFPINTKALELTKLDNLIWIQGKKNCGVIEGITIEQSATTSNVKVIGRFAESYFARRLIKNTFNFNGKVEEAMRELVTLADIPRVRLGKLNGFNDKTQFQATYKNTLTYIEKLSQASNIGFRLVPNFDEKVFYFETYKGLDKSEEQRDRPRVIFSQINGDISKADYNANSQNYSNVCYVGGQGEGSSRQVVICGDDSLTGLDRRETFINGSDISKDNLSDSQYLESLKQRGESNLKEKVLVKSLEKEDRMHGTYNYPVDYDVGDIVTSRLEFWNVKSNDRVVSVSEIYEHGKMVAVPTLGTPLASNVDWSDNL